ncbi:PREDICTED: microtubule-associated protein TORTIFOLIA1 [Nelumbo nucifera]|uniref:Microtubule-associated protein TORTIFOLIA1 n=2 Tax=Nelumbo nucifera TaxID=4432 RepID=A0A1U7Z137_NELNU|nr:PREDICTED: microtubule-associated protein TORTIFOLIA1 [Nelumbo nucifera]XP_010245733.1 PREDICTED: microtubule-associated protein TORTIFOLIA1 [Nelumbo nucifera]XP_010245734.1 PREDICTED: microtubule-associated protein TORTIFOLIA1 [Nelumbo nucifera]XP_010245735.1 PREDICTED: microtubule-associated protein TORTIFOLIA1 [Nelumbo nucifera]XP_010245736.1 PREDICTED: microtubule-associated protein TORTIFOLIA1 [Nelumbo nucifera]DAD46246.1 TPA_asm: hypothetical protein HUJ06_004476 [Nelumbo nucifera]
MKAHTNLKAKGPSRAGTQQAIFELKHRVVLALNKLADRDTYQIGVEELEKIAEGLTPEGIAPFLSCIIDTDSEQKSTVRKECIRILGTLVRFHEGLLAPHLGKMVTSIVKRLKDPDSVVRDACVETMSVLASKVSSCGGESDGFFVVLVKPLFEALGEQNRQVQFGSALCLARVIDNSNDPPVSILLRMLPRVIKLLKNPHFMAKPAVIELIRSILQAGGAPTQNSFSSALTSIQEALKNSDWTTRKAASVALGGIAVNGGSFLGSFKSSCIRSLESCRFDKVKPVRDSVLQAIQYWKSIPGSDSPEPSEAGSSTKENFCGGDYSDLTSASDGGWKDVTFKKVSARSLKKRIPLTVRKTCLNNVEDSQHSKANDWHIEIAVPKTHTVSLADTHNEESEGSCVTKTFERTNGDAAGGKDVGYDYAPIDDKQECSSVLNLVTNFENKHVTVARDSLEGGGVVQPVGINHRPAAEKIVSEHRNCSARIEERKSLDSTITELSNVHGCCAQTVNEMAFIRKQLLEIENKQSNLLDLLQVFMGNTMESLSMLQSKVFGLEHAVDKIAQDIVYSGNHSNMASSKLLKNLSVSSSPRLSTCSPRPSIDMNNRQPSLLSMKNREVWEEAVPTKNRSSASIKQGIEMWRDPTLNIIRNPIAKGVQQSFRRVPQSGGCCQTKKTEDSQSTFARNADDRKNSSDSNNNSWKRVKDFLCAGDLESAFMEALCSGDDLILIELLDRTGPVLESLSHETVSEILSTLSAQFLDQRYLDSIIPWLQQVVDLSNTHGPNYLVPSAKVRKEFLSAIQEAATMDFLNPAERRSITQLAMKLRQLWGKCS